ncbi:MAG: altronate dehydratase family protein [Thermomicrobiales bacterium]
MTTRIPVSGAGLTPGAPKGPVPINELTVRLDPADKLVIAKTTLLPGTVLQQDDGSEIRVRQLIPQGHKVALAEVAAGDEILKYGQIIGFATQPIEIGQHIHSHNLAVGELHLDYAMSSAYEPVEILPVEEQATWMGYRRPDGRVSTRNYVAVIASVNCSSSATVAVAEYFRTPGVLDAFPNVDGVIARTRADAARVGSKHLHILQRTLAGIVDHPNVAGYVMLSLGCEGNQPDDMIEFTGLEDARGGKPKVITIQLDGGFRKTVELGIEAVKDLLPCTSTPSSANRCRHPELVVALASAVDRMPGRGRTANPGLGKAVDLLVKHGGTAALGETTEAYGGEHLLTRRAKSPVAQTLLDMIHWWEEYTAYFGASIDNNPAPKQGGWPDHDLRKSLGAIAGRFDSAQRGLWLRGTDHRKGFVHVDSPGYDPVAVTGQVASGCNLVVFTTGRGSAFGFKPAPSVKIATNSDLYARQEPDMDINAGVVLDGLTLDDLGQQIFEKMLAVASGEQSKSEAAGVGQEEFNPWILGATL